MFDREYDVGSLVSVQPVGQDFRFLVTPRFRTHYETEEFEAFTQRLVSRFVRRATTFVDVGAHHGFYSLLAAHHNPAIRILACEPIPETAEILARNIQDHHLAGCTIHRCAISSTTGHATIHRSMASTTAVSAHIPMLRRSALKPSKPGPSIRCCRTWNQDRC